MKSNTNKKKINKNKNKNKKKNIKTAIDSFRENPRESFINLWDEFKLFIHNNKFFMLYLLFAVFNSFLLRFLTANVNNNAFKIETVLSDFTIVCFIGAFSFLFKKRKYLYLLIWTWIFSIICVINSTYYTFYTSFASISSLSTLKFITSVGDAVVENVFSLKDLVYLVFPLIFIFIHKRYTKNGYFEEIKFNDKNRKKFSVSIITSFVTLLLFSTTLSSTDVSRLVKQWNREYIVMKYGIYVYHVNDAIKSMEPKLASLFGYDNALKNFKEYYSKDNNYTGTNNYTNIFEGKNIIVIHAESVQNFVIGMSFNGQEITPNLNKLASKSIYFDNFYTQVSVGTSSDTEFTFNTSLMPATYGTAFGNYFDKEYVSTPKLLKDKGYYTFAMHGNNGDFWNRRIMHKNLGYDDLYAKDTYDIDEVIGLGISDVSFLTQSVEKLKTISAEHDKYYGTVITLSNHTPFSDTDKYGEFDVSLHETVINPETGLEEEVTYPYMEDTKLGNYFKSVHYADYALGVFFNLLEENGLLENTVIILYGDHDARLPKKDYIRLYNYDKENDDVLDKDDPNYIPYGEYQYELNRKTPLIIYSKDRENKSERVSYIMGMYDVQSTIGNMFGFKNEYALGHDIFNIKDKNIVVFPTGNWLTKEMYYNSQKNESYVLGDAVIEEGYIENNTAYADNLLKVSNDILLYDLIKNSRLEANKVNENEILGDVSS